MLDERSEVSLMLMAYGGSWNMSGVLPARAVCGEGDGTRRRPAAATRARTASAAGTRFHPSQGGASQRVMALTSYRRRIDGGDIEATLFGLHSNLQLFPNDGIAASFQPAGMQYGSQVEQDDTAPRLGANLRITQTLDVAGHRCPTTVGLQFRNDASRPSSTATEQRQRLDGMPGIPGPVTDSGINETELGAYSRRTGARHTWLRFVPAGASIASTPT